MTRRTGLVVAGLGILGGSFGLGTALAMAQTTSTETPATTTPSTGANQTPSTGEDQTPHSCPHRDGSGGGGSTGEGAATNSFDL
jgi:hypothetical protein